MNWLWGGIPFQSPSSDDALLTKQMLETLEPHLHFKERPPFLHGVRKIAPPPGGPSGANPDGNMC